MPTLRQLPQIGLPISIQLQNGWNWKTKGLFSSRLWADIECLLTIHYKMREHIAPIGPLHVRKEDKQVGAAVPFMQEPYIGVAPVMEVVITAVTSLLRGPVTQDIESAWYKTLFANR